MSQFLPEQNDNKHPVHYFFKELLTLPAETVLVIELKDGLCRIITPETEVVSPDQIHVIIARRCSGTAADLKGNNFAYECSLMPQIVPGIAPGKLPKVTTPRLQKTVHETISQLTPQLSAKNPNADFLSEKFVVVCDEVTYDAKAELKLVGKTISAVAA